LGFLLVHTFQQPGTLQRRLQVVHSKKSPTEGTQQNGAWLKRKRLQKTFFSLRIQPCLSLEKNSNQNTPRLSRGAMLICTCDIKRRTCQNIDRFSMTGKP
ncbi:unnamed protein product, partial [Ectocarpus sp. 8 AP-2014]